MSEMIWITTCVDILDKGKVPILFSVEQMRNLRMNIEHTPVGEFLTCPLFGCNAPLWRSAHPIIWLLTLWLLQHQVGNRCKAFNQKTLRAQRVQVNIVHTQTKKVARNMRSEHMSRNRPRQCLRRMSRNPFHQIQS